MSAIIVNGQTPFGGMSNTLIDNLQAANQAIARLTAAAAAAASGFGGTAGTEFETGSNFGVAAGGTPGTQGAAWQFAIDTIGNDWATFWTAAQGAITALDNG